MENRVEYRVLSPDSVAWYIQAALVADQNGNEHTRDLALCEAARVAAERRLVEPMKRYDCRTIDQRLAELADKLSRVDGRMLARLDALEAVVSEQAMQIETLLFRINDTQDSLQRHRSRIQAMEIVWRALGTSARKLGKLEATIQAAYDADNDAGTVTWIDMTLLRMMQGMALAELSDMVGGA